MIWGEGEYFPLPWAEVEEKTLGTIVIIPGSWATSLHIYYSWLQDALFHLDPVAKIFWKSWWPLLVLLDSQGALRGLLHTFVWVLGFSFTRASATVSCFFSISYSVGSHLSFLLEYTTGTWMTVYRRDRKCPFKGSSCLNTYIQVSLSEGAGRSCCK